MPTGQSPKTRGHTLERIEKIAFQGLIAQQREIERMSTELRANHDEFLGEVEDRLGMPGILTGAPPTHYVDQTSWNVVEIPATPELPAAQSNQNGTPRIRTHADADTIAAELGLTFDEGATVKQKVEAIKARRVETAAPAGA